MCGARFPFVYVSARGLCEEHGRQRMHQNVTGLHEHQGPAFQRWREAMARSVGGALLDEQADES